MSGEHELPTASVVRLSQATPARRGGQLCTMSDPQGSTYRSQFGVQATGATSVMRAVRTPHTVLTQELVHLLRTERLLSNDAYRTPNDLYTTVLDVLHLCQLDIRRHGSESFVWVKDGATHTPVAEPRMSKFLAGYLSSHGAARNFDVTCEPVVGTGSLDFHVVAPILNGPLSRIAIEAKKADSPQLVSGFEKQMPEYMHRLGTPYGIFLVYWLKSSNYPHPSQDTYQALEIEKLHPLRGGPTVRSVCIDFSLGPTPSRL